MGKFTHLQSSFIAGELSPVSTSRTDFEDYERACTKSFNGLPRVEGMWSKRPGTEVVSDFNGGNLLRSSLIPFWTENERFLISINTRSGSALPGATIFNYEGVQQGATDIYANFVGPSGLLDSTEYNHAQLGDVLVITHSSGQMRPMFIFRDFTTGNFSIFPLGVAEPQGVIPGAPTPLLFPFRPSNITDTSITLGDVLLGTGMGGSPTVSSTQVALTSSAALFDVGMVGSPFRITVGATESSVIISQVLSPTDAVANISLGADSAVRNSPSTDWSESAWSDFRGWPKTVAFFRRRLVWGGSSSNPDTLWASLTDNIFHLAAERFVQDRETTNLPIDSDEPDNTPDATGLGFFGRINNSDPFNTIVGDQEVNEIVWLTPLRTLNIGTSGSEYVSGGAFNLNDVSFTPQTAFGGRAGRVSRVGSHVIYTTRDGRRVRNFRFSESNGSNVSINLSLLAEHIGRLGIRDMVYQMSNDVLWITTKDRKLVSLTYDPETNAVGWAQHDLGVDCQVHGMAVVQNPDEDNDTLFLSVSRGVDIILGRSFTLERMAQHFEGDSLATRDEGESFNPIYTDASIVEVLTAPKQIFNLIHVAGQTVQATVNGFFIGEFEVGPLGDVDLGKMYPVGTRVVIGLPYKAVLDTIDYDRGGDFGSTKGSIQRLDRAITRFFKSFGVRIGNPDEKMITYPVKEFGTDIKDIMEAETKLQHSSCREQRVRICSELPYPCNVVSIALRGASYD